MVDQIRWGETVCSLGEDQETSDTEHCSLHDAQLWCSSRYCDYSLQCLQFFCLHVVCFNLPIALKFTTYYLSKQWSSLQFNGPSEIHFTTPILMACRFKFIHVVVWIFSWNSNNAIMLFSHIVFLQCLIACLPGSWNYDYYLQSI